MNTTIHQEVYQKEKSDTVIMCIVIQKAIKQEITTCNYKKKKTRRLQDNALGLVLNIPQRTSVRFLGQSKISLNQYHHGALP